MDFIASRFLSAYGKGLKSRYGHNKEILVKMGEVVEIVPRQKKNRKKNRTLSSSRTQTVRLQLSLKYVR